MNIKEAINERCSRRTYRPEYLREKDVKCLNEMIREINEEQGLHLQLIMDEGNFSKIKLSYGMFKNVHGFIAMVGRSDHPNLKEVLGYFGEKLILLATSMGLGTCWVGGTYKKDSCICEVEPGERLEAIITIGYVEENQHMKEKVISSFAKRKRKKAVDMLQSDEQVPDWILEGLEAVEKAPSAMNKQPVEFLWKDGTLKAHIEGEHGFEEMDLGIAKLHFELGTGMSGKWEWGNDANFLLQSSEPIFLDN